MKTLIAYATKSGATSECAQLLAGKISDGELYDLNKGIPDLNAYDLIILGSGVRIGRFYKPMRSFIAQHETQLKQKKTAVFLCNAVPASTNQAIEINVPDWLVSQSVAVTSFGGKPPFKKATKLTWMLTDNLDKFVAAVNAITAETEGA